MASPERTLELKRQREAMGTALAYSRALLKRYRQLGAPRCLIKGQQIEVLLKARRITRKQAAELRARY